jgi:hypothetical protein
MSDFNSTTEIQTDNQKRIGLWAAGILTALSLAFLSLSIYIVYWLQAGRFDLSDAVLMPVTGVFFLANLVALSFIWRDRVKLLCVCLQCPSLIEQH